MRGNARRWREAFTMVEFLNTAKGSPDDLRFIMNSDMPPTDTNGTVQEEMDRVWVLYDNG